MWIRTQDRDVIVEIYKFYLGPTCVYPRQDYCVYGLDLNGKSQELGYYTSKKEAQFVLGQIYDQLILYPDTLVYQMPTTTDVQRRMSEE